MSCYGRAALTPAIFIRAPSTLSCRVRCFCASAASRVEKNLEAFLELDLPGTKMVVGDRAGASGSGQKNIRKPCFLARARAKSWRKPMPPPTSSCFRARPTAFGLVLLEALASGLPVAAFPVTGPCDVIGSAPVGALNDDLREACLAAMTVSPQACLAFAATHTWEASAHAFVQNIINVRPLDRQDTVQILR